MSSPVKTMCFHFWTVSPEVIEKQLLSCPHIPSSKKLNTFPRDLQKIGSDSNFFPQQYTDDTSFAHARSSQTTISTPTLYSEVAIANKNNLQHRRNAFRVSTLPHRWPFAKRQPVTAAYVGTFLRLHLSNQKQQVSSQPETYMIPAISIMHNVFFKNLLFCKMSVFRDMLCFLSSVVRVFEKCCWVVARRVYVTRCRVWWHVAVFCESLQRFVKYSCVFFSIMLSCFWPSG